MATPWPTSSASPCGSSAATKFPCPSSRRSRDTSRPRPRSVARKIGDCPYFRLESRADHAQALLVSTASASGRPHVLRGLATRRAPALGLRAAGAADGPGSRGPRLVAEPGRRVPRFLLQAAGAASEPAGRSGPLAASRHPRPHRPPAVARGAAGVPGRRKPRRLRAGGGPAPRQPPARRALGTALDGRLALLRLVRAGEGSP